MTEAPLLERRRTPLWRLVRANAYDVCLLVRESWLSLAAFAALVLGASAYLVVTRHTGTLPAVYETLKMLVFQSALDLPADWVGRLLFFVVPLLGLTIIFQAVLNFGRLLLDKGSRLEAWQVALASTCRDHVIVCGLGHVGLRVVGDLLEAGTEAVVIERDWDSEFVERALHLKVPVVRGDAREPATLRAAGIARARSVVVAIDHDMRNIEIALAARALRPDGRVVMRVFNEELDRNLERDFGLNSAFNTAALAAPTLTAAAVVRNVDCVLPAEGGLLAIGELAVGDTSPLRGRVEAVEARHTLHVLHHLRADGSPAVGLGRELQAGDRVTVLGPLGSFEKASVANEGLFGLPPPTGHGRYDTVIVAGLGKVGHRVVEDLHRMVPRPRIVVVRLTDDGTPLARRICRLDGVSSHIGDAREAEHLLQAGIQRACAVVAATSDDLLNLQVALAARRLRPDVHVVLRVFGDALATRLADLFGIRTVYSTAGLAAATLTAAALIGGVSHAFTAGGRLLALDRLPVGGDSPLAGRRIGVLRDAEGAHVVALRREGQLTLVPPPDTCLVPGDEVGVVAAPATLARLRRQSGAAARPLANVVAMPGWRKSGNLARISSQPSNRG